MLLLGFKGKQQAKTTKANNREYYRGVKVNNLLCFSLNNLVLTFIMLDTNVNRKVITVYVGPQAKHLSGYLHCMLMALNHKGEELSNNLNNWHVLYNRMNSSFLQLSLKLGQNELLHF